MTMTTRERRTTRRSRRSNSQRSTRERLNEKFVSCCGRLECMSYRCGRRSSAARSRPIAAALLVRVHRIVAAGQRAAERGEARARGRAAPWPTTGRCARALMNGGLRQRNTRESGHRHVTPEGVRDQVDRVAEARQGPNPVIFAERRPTGLEERLRGNHHYVHGLSGPTPAGRGTEGSRDGATRLARLYGEPPRKINAEPEPLRGAKAACTCMTPLALSAQHLAFALSTCTLHCTLHFAFSTLHCTLHLAFSTLHFFAVSASP